MGLQNLGDEEIVRLCYFFCKINDDLVSFRHLSEIGVTLAVTCKGQAIQYSAVEGSDDEEQLSKITISMVVQSMKSTLTAADCSDRRKLLGYGLLWLLADAFGLPDIFEEMLHPNSEMFGFSGKESIIESKRFLLGAEERGSPNYKIDAIHQIDCPNRAVVANFQCLLPGKEGFGTDVPKFDENWKVIKVEAIRHGIPFSWQDDVKDE
ncbi:unnamed protein product [Cylindrotheca closterium]|uniref:Uncharacterized protein n=1 Tax=Cylindrotheca closterium TaxID=2856 RepID=A0AAD2G7A3_9STRA|nr:unnamed protein product [Cylindrotheca closterium]